MRVGHRRDPALELREHFVAVAFGGGQEIGDVDFGLIGRLEAVPADLDDHKMVTVLRFQHVLGDM